MVDDKEDDDFMCMRVGSEKAIATYKGVTVVASKCKANSEDRSKKRVTAKSWRHKLILQLRFIYKER